MKKYQYLTMMCCFMLICVNHVFAWNNVGHRVIAQMAYDHLTPKAKTMLLGYNQALNRRYARRSFVNSSVWLDQLYTRKLRSLRKMHYIDLAFTRDKNIHNLPAIKPINAVWAIRLAINRMHLHTASKLEKGMALRFLLHLIADIHQPLHAATCISSEYPYGDHGGNYVYLRHNKVANNLHAYWDRGAGLWLGKWSSKKVKEQARSLAKIYPCTPSTMHLNPEQWAQESHALAIKYAYVDQDTHKDYQSVAQKVIAERTALSACRLAAVLNSL